MHGERLIANLEAVVKGLLFDCRRCGQCVLSSTGLICPMTCPKGLRNGPCGGTTAGMCEVNPDRRCVWVRIRERTQGGDVRLPPLLPSVDTALFRTSSYINAITGRDHAGRIALSYPAIGERRTAQPVQTESTLEMRLKQGVFVRTCEVRAPRDADFSKMRREASAVMGHFDAVNVTAFLNGKPSLPSSLAASRLADLGIEAIAQATGRDHTKTSFISELMTNHVNGVHNVLCLTGDGYSGRPRSKQVYDMDSSLMLYEARMLRETGVIRFTGDTLPDPPRPFLGAVINPFSSPDWIPLIRLKQKAACGADFIQTQLVFDVDRFGRFMAAVCRESLDRELFVLAGVPVITSRKALAALSKVPGVRVPEDVLRRLEASRDIRREGAALAREIVSAVAEIRGVAGVHLMLFGSDHSVLPEVVRGLRGDSETAPGQRRPAELAASGQLRAD